MHLHLASHLGTLDEPREGCDVGAEPEDGVWWTYPEGGRTGQVLGRRCSPSECRLTNTNLVLDQGKPRSILSLLCLKMVTLSIFIC